MSKLCLHIDSENYASDYAYSVIYRKKALKVEKNTSSFIMFDASPQLYLYIGSEREEIPNIRSRGAVIIRNRGKNKGKLFIYKTNALPSRSHDVIGKINGNFDWVEEGMEVKFEIYPERIITIGLSQEEGEKILNRRGIEQKREEEKSNKAIIIDQEPMYTTSILKKKKLHTIGIAPQEIMNIKLYPDAKETLFYFYFASFSFGRPVGKLKVSKKYKSFVLFKSYADEYKKPIIPENTPSFSKKYSIGISNMSSKNQGNIGIRLRESERYGQTGEIFKNVNLIGEVVNGRSMLEEAKEGEEIYYRIVGA